MKKDKINFTKSEKKSFLNGVRCQFNKEHPKENYAVICTHHYIDDNGNEGQFYDCKMGSHAFKTKKEAIVYLEKASINNKAQELRLRTDAKKGQLNSTLNSYYTTRIEKINARKGIRKGTEIY